MPRMVPDNESEYVLSFSIIRMVAIHFLSAAFAAARSYLKTFSHLFSLFITIEKVVVRTPFVEKNYFFI